MSSQEHYFRNVVNSLYREYSMFEHLCILNKTIGPPFQFKTNFRYFEQICRSLESLRYRESTYLAIMRRIDFGRVTFYDTAVSIIHKYFI